MVSYVSLEARPGQPGFSHPIARIRKDATSPSKPVIAPLPGALLRRPSPAPRLSSGAGHAVRGAEIMHIRDPSDPSGAGHAVRGAENVSLRAENQRSQGGRIAPPQPGCAACAAASSTSTSSASPRPARLRRNAERGPRGFSVWPRGAQLARPGPVAPSASPSWRHSWGLGRGFSLTF